MAQLDASRRAAGVISASAGNHAQGEPIHELADVDTVAEGIADTRLFETTAANVREVVDDVVSVSDREIATAVTLLAERAKTVVEGAGAAPLAAALSDAVDVTDEHVAVVISGGNVNLTEHAELTRTGLHELGRYTEARLAVDGWPTAVSDVVETVEAEGAELDVLERARRGSGLGTGAVDNPNRVPVTVGLEGSGPDHLAGVLDAIAELDAVDVLSSLPEE